MKKISISETKDNIRKIKGVPGNGIIPEFIKRIGTMCTFRYTNGKEFFNKYKIECLRLITMYSLFLFGHKKDSNTFVAQYDPVRQQIFKCSKDWLLTCAFYNLPCRGAYFHIYGNPETLTNYELPTDIMKTNYYKMKLDNKEYLNEDKYLDYDQIYTYSTKNLKHSRMDELFQKQNEKNFMELIFSDSTKNYSLLTDETDNKDVYEEKLIKLIEKNGCKTCYTNTFEYVVFKGIYRENNCRMCDGIDHEDEEEGVLKMNLHSNNNLICDFSKNKLVVMPLDISKLHKHTHDDTSITGSLEELFYDTDGDHMIYAENWIGSLIDTDHKMDFNHASCQGTYYSKPSSVDFKIEKKFDNIYFVDHVDLIVITYDDDIIIITNYDGLVAL